MSPSPPKPTKYPLVWPSGYKRTPVIKRSGSRFRTRSFGRSRDDLKAELRRLGATGVVLSTNVELRQDGEPYSSRKPTGDPGVAVYFNWKNRAYAMACDRYLSVGDNVRAIYKTIEGMRTIDRHGASDMLERAFTGFSALPPSGDVERPWWEVIPISDELLQIRETFGAQEDSAATSFVKKAMLKEVEKVYRGLVADAHPDAGGSAEKMRELNDAIAAARTELS